MKTYGTATLEGRSWWLDVVPHVAIKLKRVFPSVNQTHTGTACLSDTLENCRTLAWFMERYPLKVTPEKYLRRREKEHRKHEETLHSFVTGARELRSFALAVPARDYQRVAADLALTTQGLLVADDLGVGKTVTGICMLVEAACRPALVVVPTHMQLQWERQIARFAPQLRTHILRSKTPYDLARPRERRRAAAETQLSLVDTHPDVLISTYHKLDGWIEALTGKVRSVIFDECAELRTGLSSDKGIAAKGIADGADYRLGLSATPIYNYGSEIFNVLDVLAPGKLGSRAEFVREWCEDDSLKDPTAFGVYARDAGLMLRRTRKDVGRELPPLTKVTQAVECDTKALDAVDGTAYELAKIILAQTERKLTRGEQFRAGGDLDNLMRQATGIAKAPYVAAFVKMLLESGEKVLLFGWHRAVYDIWAEALKDHRPGFYTGTESAKEKDAAAQAFIRGETRLLIMSLRSGSGLDGLQDSGCHVGVFGELDWSPAVLEQGIGRYHRDGQEEPCLVYYLLSDSGSDPIMADVLGLKRVQLEGIRNPHGSTDEVLVDTGGAHVRRLAEELVKKKRGHLSPVRGDAKETGPFRDLGGNAE